MTIGAVKKRYGIASTKEMLDIIRKHIDTINADGTTHCSTVDKKWYIDEEGISILDQIMESEANAVLEVASSGSESETIAPSKQMTKAELLEHTHELEEENAQLSESVRELQTSVNRYKKDYEKVYSNFIAYSENHGNIDTALMHNLRTEISELQSKLARVNDRWKADVASRDSRITELENRIDNLQEEATVIDQLRTDKLRCELELSTTKKEQDRLLKDLRQTEKKVIELESHAANMLDEKKTVISNNQIMSNEVLNSVDKLVNVIKQLEKACEIGGRQVTSVLTEDTAENKFPQSSSEANNENTDIVSESLTSIAEPKEEVSLPNEPLQDTSTANTVAPAKTAKASPRTLGEMNEERDRLFEELRKEQSKDNENKSKGLFSFIRNKAASFF